MEVEMRVSEEFLASILSGQREDVVVENVEGETPSRGFLEV